MLFEPSRDKTNKVSVRPVKTQISLGIRPVWSESSLSAWRNLVPLATHWAHSIVFAGCRATLLVLSRGGSFVDVNCQFYGQKVCFTKQQPLSFLLITLGDNWKKCLEKIHGLLGCLTGRWGSSVRHVWTTVLFSFVYWSPWKTIKNKCKKGTIPTGMSCP